MERESPSCCWTTALQPDSSGKSVTAKWDLVPDVSMGQGPAKKERVIQVLWWPWEPHAMGAVPHKHAAVLLCSLPCGDCPGSRLLPPRKVRCLVCRVFGAQGSTSVGSSGMSLAVWEVVGRRSSPHMCPRARRAEGELTPVPTPMPYLLPSVAPTPVSAWSGAAKSLHPRSPVLPQPAAWGPRSPHHQGALSGSPATRVQPQALLQTFHD